MARINELGTYHLSCSTKSARQYLTICPFQDFSRASSEKAVIVFQSTLSKGTKIGRVRVAEIKIELTSTQGGTAATASYRVNRAFRSEQIGYLFTFAGFFIVSIVVLAEMVRPLGLVAGIISTVAFLGVSTEMLRWHNDVHKKLNAIFSECAQSVGGFSAFVPTNKGGWPGTVVTGVIFLPLLAFVPHLLTTPACLWVIPLFACIGLWLVMIASKLAQDAVRWSMLIANPRVLLVGGIAFVLALPGMYYGIETNNGDIGLPMFIVVVVFFALFVLLPVRRIAQISMVRIAHGLDHSPSRKQEASWTRLASTRLIYGTAIIILSSCVYVGIIISFSALLGVNRLGHANLNPSLSIAALPALILLGVQQAAAVRGVFPENDAHLKRLNPIFQRVHQVFLDRGWLSEGHIELSGPLKSVAVIGPSVICQASLKNRWVIVIPPWFADRRESYIETLLAHELAHISCQGLKSRVWRVMGIISCVGVSGLLPLIGLQREEDEADARTLEYLRHVGVPSSTLRKSILALGCRKIMAPASKRLEAEFQPRAVSWALLINGNMPINAVADYSLRRVTSTK